MLEERKRSLFGQSIPNKQRTILILGGFHEEDHGFDTVFWFNKLTRSYAPLVVLKFIYNIRLYKTD